MGNIPLASVADIAAAVDSVGHGIAVDALAQQGSETAHLPWGKVSSGSRDDDGSDSYTSSWEKIEGEAGEKLKSRKPGQELFEIGVLRDGKIGEEGKWKWEEEKNISAVESSESEARAAAIRSSTKKKWLPNKDSGFDWS